MENTSVEQFPPTSCSEPQLAHFKRILLSGNEVTDVGIDDRILRAEQLAFFFENGTLRGIGALKRPNRQYRLARFRKAGVAQLGARYEREIGWIVVEPQCRSRGYSKLIVKSLLEAGKAAVFATTRVANEPMRRTLRSCGFAEVGSPFASERGDYELMLYVRPFLGN